jgi:hypothetical protein
MEMALNRREGGVSAFSHLVPVLVKVISATLAVLVFASPTVGPSIGLLVGPSVTVTVDSKRGCHELEEEALNAHKIS